MSTEEKVTVDHSTVREDLIYLDIPEDDSHAHLTSTQARELAVKLISLAHDIDNPPAERVRAQRSVSQIYICLPQWKLVDGDEYPWAIIPVREARKLIAKLQYLIDEINCRNC